MKHWLLFSVSFSSGSSSTFDTPTISISTVTIHTSAVCSSTIHAFASNSHFLNILSWTSLCCVLNPVTKPIDELCQNPKSKKNIGIQSLNWIADLKIWHCWRHHYSSADVQLFLRTWAYLYQNSIWFGVLLDWLGPLSSKPSSAKTLTIDSNTEISSSAVASALIDPSTSTSLALASTSHSDIVMTVATSPLTSSYAERNLLAAHLRHWIVSTSWLPFLWLH